MEGGGTLTQGTLKRHAGSYDWQTVVGATGGKIGFYGAAPVVQPSGADQAAVTLGNTEVEIGGLTISNLQTQAGVQALRDACEELGDEVRALLTLVNALWGRWWRGDFLHGESHCHVVATRFQRVLRPAALAHGRRPTDFARELRF